METVRTRRTSGHTSMSKPVSLKESILGTISHEKNAGANKAVRISVKPPTSQKKRKPKKKTLESIRREQKLKRRARLAGMSEGERRDHLAREAQARRDKRAAETEEQKAERRARQAERLRASRATARRGREDDIQRLRDSRASESDIQKAVRRQRNAEQMRIRRANLTEEEALEQREKQAQRMRDMRAAKKQQRQTSQETLTEDGIAENIDENNGDSFVSICKFLELRVNTNSMMSHSDREEQKPYEQP